MAMPNHPNQGLPPQVHQMPPPPPMHLGPHPMNQAQGPGMQGLQQSMHAMNMNMNMNPNPNPPPQARKLEEVIDLTKKSKPAAKTLANRPADLEGYTFRKEAAEKGATRTWLKAVRTEMMLPHAELEKMVKRNDKNSTALFQRYKNLPPNQLAQVERLLQDKNKQSFDSGAEWRLAYLNTEKQKKGWSGPTETSAITAILKKDAPKPANDKANKAVGAQAGNGAAGGRPNGPPNGFAPHPQMGGAPPQFGGHQQQQQQQHPQMGGGHQQPPPPPMPPQMQMPPQARPPNTGPPHQGQGRQAPVIVLGGPQGQQRPNGVPPQPPAPPGVVQVPPVNHQRNAPPPPGAPSPRHGNGTYPIEVKSGRTSYMRTTPRDRAPDRVAGWVRGLDDDEDDDFDSESEDDSVETPPTSLGSFSDRRRRKSLEVKTGSALRRSGSRGGGGAGPPTPRYREHRRQSFSPAPPPRRRDSFDDVVEEVSLRDPWSRRSPPGRGAGRATSYHDDHRLVTTTNPRGVASGGGGSRWRDQMHEDALLHDQLAELRHRDRELAIREQMMQDRAHDIAAAAAAQRQHLQRARTDPYFPRGGFY